MLAAAAVALAVGAALASCSSSGTSGTPEASLPDATQLLKDSAAAMRKVQSARFELNGNGSIAGVEVRSAVGVVTSSGDAQGSVQVFQNGQLVHLDLVVKAGVIYIKGPTGGFEKLPPGAAGSAFDPSQVDLDGSLVSRLMPLPAVNTVPGTLWIGKDSPELEQIAVTVPKSGAAEQTQLTLRLFDFGVEVDITPPA